MRDRYNLLTTRMQAKLKMEDKSTGNNVETSELDALLEEVLEKEKELVILNEIWSMTEKKKILDVSERFHLLNWRSENKKQFPRRRLCPPRLLHVVVVPFVVVA